LQLGHDADEIVPGLWVGAWPRINTLAALKLTHAIEVVVFMARDAQPSPEHHQAGLEVVMAPIDDCRYMSQADERTTLMAATYVAACLIKQRPVLVTCAAGINRSAMVAALALRGALGYAPSHAIDVVRLKRHPQTSGIPVLSNDTFVKFIREVRPTAAWSRGQTPSGGLFSLP